MERRRKLAIRKAVDDSLLRIPFEKRRAARWLLEAACSDRPVNLKRQSELLEIRFGELYRLIGQCLAIFNDEMWKDLE